ncbi:MAG: flagellar biosynthesis protein FlgM [Hyphomicrobiales bacterium]|nr:MAG: flagellar biosynthesis protein FlgM [Hyphomicrobiales bacterium]
MRWKGRRESENVEDMRGASGGGFRFPFPGRGRGQGGGMPVGRRAKGGGIGIGGIILILIVSYIFGINPMELLQGGGGMAPQPGQPRTTQQPPARQSAAEKDLVSFVSVVLADTEDAWHDLFNKIGKRYEEPKLVLFSGSVRSACGFAQAAMGPFYCPGDRKVYIDLSFYKEMKQKFNAPGDFAQAYVISHEVGHHVQTLLGISQKVQQAKQRSGKAAANAIQVRMELQADCFAGVWAHHADRAKSILQDGDVEEALNAAHAIGDDTLQKRSQGYVVPDSFTHGSSAQRMRWFKIGLSQGRINACDTFNASNL